MTATTEASSSAASSSAIGASVIRDYYLAMAVPFVIDLITLLVYAGINRAPYFLPMPLGISAAFLLVGVGTGAYYLIRPVKRFLAGEVDFADIEHSISSLPRRSCAVMAVCYGPMLALRYFARRFEFGFGGLLQDTAWIDSVASFLVGTGFTVLLTFFMVSAYLDGLCEHLFAARGVNLGVFHGKFSRKIAYALLFAAFAAMIQLAADILSYEGARLIKEATIDIVASVSGTVFIYFWISRALTRPIVRLDHGMHLVAKDDYSVRLPVTSDDEMGHAVSRFNKMVEGLSEREYLRDTFGKYVSPSVATAILGNRTGRVADRTDEATLMFTDIEGFTGWSERLPPTEVARVLNAYLAAVVPAIQRHGGVVNSFIGDGLFASFNLPLPLPDHAAAALRAALDIQGTLAQSAAVGKIGLRTRIGINTGPVIGVTIGTENRLNYTLLGDAVNIASRVEQLNKEFGTTILATESTVRAAGAFATCRPLGETDVRGHAGNIVVYSVDPP
ncbi:MAG: adenylate/guanylate cyclase domain-containing protein [Alphaproteobacteria bacterium]|nr:adenylate/guanylate cyclase domain-containing protein [Alphaproteobacteria bacterium]MBV8410839.1 adenylate/guanylate cyclase domain-containing protein [Alphaproteobacteria bacterium]